MERASGVLMPVSSLPGPYGIGGFGWNAYYFVHFLASCKQHYWQFCPLRRPAMAIRPISRSRPAQATPTFIHFAELIEAGYLEQRDIDGGLGSDPAMSTTVLNLGGRRQILDRAADASPPTSQPISMTLSRPTRTGYSLL